MYHRVGTRSGYAWLELLLGLAALALLLQLFPSVWRFFFWAFDVRNWSRGAWFIANLSIVAVLVTIRFGPEVQKAWREKREQTASNKVKADKAMERKEQREMIERLKESRKRRLY